MGKNVHCLHICPLIDRSSAASAYCAAAPYICLPSTPSRNSERKYRSGRSFTRCSVRHFGWDGADLPKSSQSPSASHAPLHPDYYCYYNALDIEREKKKYLAPIMYKFTCYGFGFTWSIYRVAALPLFVNNFCRNLQIEKEDAQKVPWQNR